MFLALQADMVPPYSESFSTVFKPLQQRLRRKSIICSIIRMNDGAVCTTIPFRNGGGEVEIKSSERFSELVVRIEVSFGV